MFRGVLASAALLAVAWSPAAAQSQQTEVPARAVRKHSGAAAHLDGTLSRMLDALPTAAPAAAAAIVPRAVGDKVPVTIRFKRGQAPSLDALRPLGISPANVHADVLEAYVRVDVLASLAQREDVDFIETILPPQPQATSQGVAVHQASSWHAAGRSGAGVKVGVIDVGFIGLGGLRETELPTTVIGRCYTAVGSYSDNLADCERNDVHGTAVAETIADMAPGIELYVANPYSPLDLRQTVDWMVTQGVQIINHSVSWSWSGPGDGTSPFADSPLYAVDAAASAGVLWTNAAGNAARSSWTGAFSDAEGDSVMEFSGVESNAVTLQAGTRFIAQARWQDSWTNAARDLDLYLRDQWGNYVAWSQNVQGGAAGQTPRETLTFTPLQTATYYLSVARYSGSIPGWVQVQAFTGEPLQFAVAAYSICNPAESSNPSLLAVGAAMWSTPGAVESFSSRGPTRDGRMKPDVVGADGADTVTYGPTGFFGTSQAAPHVAGLAALVMESFPATPAGSIAQYLRTVASARGTPNNTWGTGFSQVPNFPATISVSALLSSASYPATRGQAITWTAFAIGEQAPFEYQFWLYQPNSGWSVIQDYGPSNFVTWTPLVEGTYALQVWARAVGSTSRYEDWSGTGYFSVAPPPPVRLTALTADRALPVWIGTPMTWTATATGGVSPVQYQFWLYREGVGWSLGQDYSPDNTYAWTPTVAGRYALQAWARSADSTNSYDAWKGTSYFQIDGPPPVSVTGLTSNVTFPSPAGSPITWTATASGGSSALQYQFWLSRGGAWAMVRDYSSTNTYTWVPGAGDAGACALQVWVRQVEAAVAYEAWRGMSFTIAPPPAVRVTSLSANVAFPTLIGREVTWSAVASGGIAPLQYQFWVLANGTWSVLQDYSVSHTATLTPTSAGDYVIQVWVRSSGSTAAYEDWRGSGYWNVQDSALPVIDDLSANVTFPATERQPITWIVRAAGGTLPLEYQFWLYRQGAGWSMVQDYGTGNTFTWTPGIGDAGTYNVQVWVRNAGSTARYDAWQGTPQFQILPAPVLQMTSDAGDYIGQGVTQFYASPETSFTATRKFDAGLTISAIDPGYEHWWFLDFGGPRGVPLTRGVYSYATRYAFRNTTDAGLDVGGDGRGCNELWGRFVVHDVAYAPDGSVNRFAADFEQHCEGFAPALFGTVRYGAATPLTPVRTLSANEPGPIRIGTPVSWTAPQGAEYRIWRYGENTRTWSLVHDYDAGPTYTWTPQPGDEGNWSVVAWERAAGSPVLYDGWRSSGRITVEP